MKLGHWKMRGVTCKQTLSYMHTADARISLHIGQTDQNLQCLTSRDPRVHILYIGQGKTDQTMLVHRLIRVT